jgi:phospholipase C
MEGNMPTTQLERIEHIVVLMLENRSFDNLFGWLYDPADQPPFNRLPPLGFEGVYGKNLSNPASNGGQIPVGKGADPTAPFPDPGEAFADVYEQIHGLPLPASSSGTKLVLPAACNMQGFLRNYERKSPPKPETIMNCFTPAVVPVLSSLAHYYGLCDHWFASIPSQTLCNRSFMQAGTSSGHVNNGGSDGILFVNDTPTIFNLLYDAKKSWKVYCGGWTITSLVLLTQRRVWGFAFEAGYFEHISDFLADAQKPGGLPAYSFIEPNYIDSVVHGPENDMHPESHPFQLFGHSNVEQGERLVYQIYNAIRDSPDWEKILLLIVFDEHGGCYDHVCPPPSISPDNVVIPPGQPGGTGFAFDRLGVRVPAIVVSAYTPQGTILNTIFDHTSALSTVVNRFTLPSGRLGKRQEKAPDVSEALTLSSPRQDRPTIPLPGAAEIGVAKRVAALGTAIVHANEKPVSELQKRLLLGAAKRLGLSPEQQGAVEKADTSLTADAELVKLEAQLAAKRVASRFQKPSRPVQQEKH